MRAQREHSGRFRRQAPKKTRPTTPRERAAAREMLSQFLNDPTAPERPDLDREDILGVVVNIVSEITYARRHAGPKLDPLASCEYAGHALDRVIAAVPHVVLALGWTSSLPDAQDSPGDVARRVLGAYVKYVDWMQRRFAPACAEGIAVQDAATCLSAKQYRCLASAFASSWKGRFAAFYLEMLGHAAPAFGPKGIKDVRRAAASAGRRSRSDVTVEEVTDLILAAEDQRAARRPRRRRGPPPLLRVAKSSRLQHVNSAEIRDFVRKLARAGKIGRRVGSVDAGDAEARAPMEESAPGSDILAAAIEAEAIDDIDRRILRARSDGMSIVATAKAIVAAGLADKFSDVAVAKRQRKMVGRAIANASVPDIAEALRRLSQAVA